jgi:hypothetical protein
MCEKQGHLGESGSLKWASDDLLKPRGHSVEVTRLGIITALIIASWSLVSDGTLKLSGDLVFVAFLLVSAGGLVWRLTKLAPKHCEDLWNKNSRTPNANSSRER